MYVSQNDKTACDLNIVEWKTKPLFSKAVDYL